MRIAQVAPLYESVPPKLYGGTERVVSYLTEELVRQGHEVTLFASGDSITRAKLVAPCPQALRLDPNCVDQLAHHVLMLEYVYREYNQFDIIHFHIDYLNFPISRRHQKPHLTTLHGRLDIPDLVPLYMEYRDMPVVSISESQRTPLPDANWQGNVYHGLAEDLYAFHEQPGTYLAFLGRISPEKRVDRAIEIAIGAGIPIKIAAKVDRVDREYFHDAIEPLLAHPLVEFIGEIGDAEKGEFLGNAQALIFPIDWPEPFGMVMIEAMACGTPVVAFLNGSVQEIIKDGANGFIVDNVADAIEAVRNVASLDRRRCREIFETRFSARQMANSYIDIYRAIIGQPTARESAA